MCQTLYQKRWDWVSINFGMDYFAYVPLSSHVNVYNLSTFNIKKIKAFWYLLYVATQMPGETNVLMPRFLVGTLSPDWCDVILSFVMFLGVTQKGFIVLSDATGSRLNNFDTKWILVHFAECVLTVNANWYVLTFSLSLPQPNNLGCMSTRWSRISHSLEYDTCV